MITFDVDEVAPVLDRKPAAKLALDTMLEAKVLATSDGVDHCVDPAVLGARGGMNGLVVTVHTAFAEHRPLTLSPDAIWLAVLQGFSIHLSVEGENLRKRFVEFEGQRTLTVTVDGTESWHDVLDEFRKAVAGQMNPGLVTAMIERFSTTSDDDHTAHVIATMSAFSRYFDYEMVTVCGIPSVTLLGTADDWVKLRDRFRVLAEFDLQWWAKRVNTVLAQLIESAKGRPDRRFWQSIYKPETHYGGDRITGWLPALFPYLEQSPGQFARNDSGFKHWVHEPIAPAALPAGFSSAQVRQDDRLLTFFSGFLGAKQLDDGSLSPLVGWAIGEAPIDVLFDKLASKFQFEPPQPDASWRNDMGTVPGLLSQFSNRFGKGVLFDGALTLHGAPAAAEDNKVSWQRPDGPHIPLVSTWWGEIQAVQEFGVIVGNLASGELIVWTGRREQRVMKELVLLLPSREAKPPFTVIANSLLEFYQRLANATSFPPWEPKGTWSPPEE